MGSIVRAALVPLTACVAATAAPAQARPFPLGKLGATVELEKPWRSYKDDGPGDHFDGSEPARLFGRNKEVWVVVTEMRALLESEADLKRALDAQGQHGTGTRVEFARGPRWTRAKRDVVTADRTWAIRYEILAKDGLAYHLMFWAAPRDAAFMAERAEDFHDGFEFPDADSPWQKQLAPAEHVLAAGEVEVVFSTRPFVLAPAEREGGERFRLQSGDGHQTLSVFAQDGNSLQATLDEELSLLRNWDTSFAEQRREQLTVDGQPRGVLYGSTGSQAFATMIVPIASRQWMCLRYWSTGSADEPRPERDALFASLRLRPLEGRLQLPELGEESRGTSDDRTALFSATLPVVGTVDTWSIEGAARDGDAWLVSTWRQLLRVTAKESQTVVTTDTEWPTFALRWRGDLLVGIRNAVHRVDNGRLGEAMPFRASCADTMGDDLLLVRPLPERLPELQAVDRLVLVRRSPAGEETTLLELPAGYANEMAVARDRSRALLSGSSHGGLIEHHAGPWLAVVDLASPSFTRLPGWVSIEALAVADAGWIVTGTPNDEPRGIWLVSPAGEREPLITGNAVQGLAATDGILTFARTSQGKCVLREAPLAACRAAGRRCQPFAARHLEAIGEKLLAELGEAGVPRTAADLAAARARADAIARASCDADLPKSAADVDALITAMQSQTVGLHARVVLTLLIATAAIDAGAQWVEGGIANWSSWFGAGAESHVTAFATPFDPRAMLVGALDDSEGNTNPLSRRERERRGRIALIGFDTAALSARAASVVPPDLEKALANADATRLAAICDQVPDNSHLRDAIYEHLAAANSIRAVENLAQRYAARPQPQATDLVAWLAAWQHRTKEPAAAREQFDAALRAVQQHPREAALYLCLGRAARLAFPAQPVKARQCFDRILSLATWDTIAGQARAELATLDKK